MPSGYICSHCGAPISPAQNRCHRCSAEIDWDKAVGRTSYLSYLPPASKRKKKRRQILTAILVLVLLILTIFAGSAWRWPPARAQFRRLWSMIEKQASPTTPAITLLPTPASLLPSSPSPAPTSPLLPPSPSPPGDDLTPAPVTPGVTPSPTVTPEPTAPPPTPTPTSPPPTPAPPHNPIAYTTYDASANTHAIMLWQAERQPSATQLIDAAMQPAYSPDHALLYRAAPPRRPGIYLHSGQEKDRRITKGPDDQWPRWAPDHSQILFTSARRSPDDSPHLYLADIATRAVEDLGPGQNGDWSRDGRIIFSGCDAGGQRCGLWLLDPTTLQRTQLTTIPDDLAPRWSPDGSHILFMSRSRSDSWDIYLLDIAANEITPIAPHPAEDGLPIWSPDGHSILFISDRDGDWAIHLATPAGGPPRRLWSIGYNLPNWQQAGLAWQP